MKPITIVRGDVFTLRFRVTEDGEAKDITGYTFKAGVKEKATDTEYKIGLLDGTIDDATGGEISFPFTEIETDQATFAGRLEVAMYDGSSNKTTLTESGGLELRIVEAII